VEVKIAAFNAAASTCFDQTAGATWCGAELAVAEATFIEMQNGDGKW
jgi:hypothetical protein